MMGMMIALPCMPRMGLLWMEDGMTPCEFCIACNMSGGYGVNVILGWTWDWVSRARTVLVLVMVWYSL
jgi:hypothetical protein